MGEEESSAKDDDDDNNDITTTNNNNNNNNSTTESIILTSDEPSKNSLNSSQSLFSSHSTPGSYASNLYNLNNTSLNTNAIHFTPNINPPGQQYRGVYPSPPYPLMPLIPPVRYPTTATVYMSSTNYPGQPSSSSNPWYSYQQQTPYGTQQYGHPQ